MRGAVALLLIGLSGLVAAFAVTHSPRAANPKLFATVGPGFSITLKDGNGDTVTSLAPGTYDIEVTDSSNAHNFDLKRPNGTSEKMTDVTGTGTVTWTVTLTSGTWTYVCDAHPDYMLGTFTVASPAATTTTPPPATTSTTTPATTVGTTVPPPTTSIVDPPPPPTTVRVVVRCSVPRLRGKTIAAARRLLVGRHCTLGSIRRAYSARAKRGLIIGQSPSAGARRARGARVSVTVSRGPRR